MVIHLISVILIFVTVSVIFATTDDIRDMGMGFGITLLILFVLNIIGVVFYGIGETKNCLEMANKVGIEVALKVDYSCFNVYKNHQLVDSTMTLPFSIK